jgi:(S)-2-hydroxy-acid oxidase
MLCIKDFENNAKKSLPKMAHDYFASGADNQETLYENERAFARILIRPRVLVDVSNVSIKTTLLGTDMRSPICIAPSAFHKLAHPDGELATVRGTLLYRMSNVDGLHSCFQQPLTMMYVAAVANETLMILSTASTSSLEDVYDAALQEGQERQLQPSLWFQLYVFKDRVITERLVRRAEQKGYKALVVTVDAPLLGKRRSDIRYSSQLIHSKI